MEEISEVKIEVFIFIGGPQFMTAFLVFFLQIYLT